MKYPGNIIGPCFETGDLVTFIFDGAEFTVRLPIVPNNKHNQDTVTCNRDFRGIDTRDWDINNQERPCIQLATQRWSFEDANSLDNVALCKLYLSVVEVTPAARKKNILLEVKTFKEIMLNWIAYATEDHEEQYLKDSNWPASANRFHEKVIEKEHLNWLRYELCYLEGTMPRPFAVAPINSRFVMMTRIEIDSLHYAGRQNPYSKELLRKFEFELFDDFLSHFDLRYSPETIAIIQSLKS